jgi:hypothetical protein
VVNYLRKGIVNETVTFEKEGKSFVAVSPRHLVRLQQTFPPFERIRPANKQQKIAFKYFITPTSFPITTVLPPSYLLSAE